MKGKLPLVHPGEVLREEYLKPLGWNMSMLATALKVPLRRVSLIVHEHRGITADTALRLGKATRDLARVLDQSAISVRIADGAENKQNNAGSRPAKEKK